MTGTRIRAVRFACGDVEAAMAFYRRAFGFRPAGADEDVRALHLGAQRLEFVPATGGEAGPPPPSNATGFQHCAIVVSSMDEAMRRLGAVSGWSAISIDGPQTLPPASGGVAAFKFRDPEGHPLEFLRFLDGRVPEPWASMAGGPCLGIDHSAITVADVDRSIAFYEASGFRLAGRQLNRGPAQGLLDGLGGDPSVEVVTLMPEGGVPPHLELLGYRSPEPVSAAVPDGSPYATVLRLADAGRGEGMTVDPDGHRLRSHGPATPRP